MLDFKHMKKKKKKNSNVNFLSFPHLSFPQIRFWSGQKSSRWCDQILESDHTKVIVTKQILKTEVILLAVLETYMRDREPMHELDEVKFYLVILTLRLLKEIMLRGGWVVKAVIEFLVLNDRDDMLVCMADWSAVVIPTDDVW